jgi:hypothetical protein
LAVNADEEKEEPEEEYETEEVAELVGRHLQTITIDNLRYGTCKSCPEITSISFLRTN